MTEITTEWVEARLLEMVRTYMDRPDSERRFLRGLISGHPQIVPEEWEHHLAAADKPRDPITGELDDQAIPPRRFPSSKQITRADEAGRWIGQFITVIETRRIVGATLVSKNRGLTTVWPLVRKMLELPPRRRYAVNTLKAHYRRGLADIAAGLRDMATTQQKPRKSMQRGGKAYQRRKEMVG